MNDINQFKWVIIVGTTIGSTIACSLVFITLLLINQQENLPNNAECVIDRPAEKIKPTTIPYTPVTFNQEYRGWIVQEDRIGMLGYYLLVQHPETKELRQVKVPEIVWKYYNDGMKVE